MVPAALRLLDMEGVSRAGSQGVNDLDEVTFCVRGAHSELLVDFVEHKHRVALLPNQGGLIHICATIGDLLRHQEVEGSVGLRNIGHLGVGGVINLVWILILISVGYF